MLPRQRMTGRPHRDYLATLCPINRRHYTGVAPELVAPWLSVPFTAGTIAAMCTQQRLPF